MARVKEFDSDKALLAAIGVFATHGFEGTSTDALLQAMGIGRQSLYDTFGDKRQLYLAALGRYTDDSAAGIVDLLEHARSPLCGIEAVLFDFARHPRRLGTSSCLGVSSVCEFGRGDVDVSAINDAAGKQLEGVFERQARAAIDADEIDESLDARDVARFLLMGLSGIKVAAQAGASRAQLESSVVMMLRSLAPPRSPTGRQRRGAP